TMANASGTRHYLYNNPGNRLDEVRDGSDTGPVVYRYIHDAAGNRIEKRDGVDAVLQAYAYDQKNRTTSLTDPSGAHTFAYDPNDFRIEKADPTRTRKYLMEGEHYEAVYDGSNALIARYLRGVVVDEIIYGYLTDQGEEKGRTFHHDHLNSVTALTGHNGDEVETVSYGPFGEAISSSGTSPSTLKYTGRELDEETGLYYYRARYYDPKIGRFLNEDPLGFEAGVNFYAYVQNNPINSNDPMGLINILFGGGVTAAAPTGAEASGGIVINPGLFGQRADIGFFGSIGATAGVNVSADIFVGYVKGGIDNVSGKTVNQNISIGPANLTIFHDANTGETMGLTLGVGPGATPVGYSGAFDVTGTATVRDFINWAMPSTPSPPGSAGGGFVIYPNKPNLNMMRAVYAK
nr:RHS repeat-associated core domain-containing protein [Desulfobacula sp.]